VPFADYKEELTNCDYSIVLPSVRKKKKKRLVRHNRNMKNPLQQKAIKKHKTPGKLESK